MQDAAASTHAVAHAIFLSYRPEDSAATTIRIYQWLLDLGVPAWEIFFDERAVSAEHLLPREAEEALKSAICVLVIMGREWARQKRGGLFARPSLFHADDRVRREVELALSVERRTVPVLVGDSRLPENRNLPPSVQPLRALNPVKLRIDDTGFAEDMPRLVEEVAIRLGSVLQWEDGRFAVPGGGLRSFEVSVDSAASHLGESPNEVEGPTTLAAETADSNELVDPPTAPSKDGPIDEPFALAATVPHVFVSHNSADNTFGRRLAADLEARLGPGTVWYDSAGGLEGGDIWWDRIVSELTRRDVFVVVVSPQAMASGWVHDEIRLAWQQKNGERGKVIVPVVHQPADVPAYVGMVQFVRFDNQPYDQGFVDLLEAVWAGETRLIRPEAVPVLHAGPPFEEGILPVPERFIGRAEDLYWVEERLRAGGATGITAVRGMGGIGKTALAAVAIRELRWEKRFTDGIAVVTCNELTDPTVLLRTILLRFDNQRQIPERTDLDTLGELARDLFAHKDVAVVLDNIEPALDIAVVTQPLRYAGVTLLLTARHMLPRAAVPEEGSRRLELLSTDEALDLFAQSYGRWAAPDLTPAQLAAARRIVSALDHHTLAVKLAGAYAKDLALDLAQFAGELEFDPLKTPDDAETPRAVALVLGRSVDAMDHDAQRLFAAAGALPTGEFGRNALLELGSVLALADTETSADLLVRRALLDVYIDETMPEGSDRVRCRLHTLLRAEARHRFAAPNWSDDECLKVSRAIAVYYAEYASRTPKSGLAHDESNISGALEWAHDHFEYQLVVRLCLEMTGFWILRGKMRTAQIYLPWGIQAAERLAAFSNGELEETEIYAGLISAYGRILDDAGKTDQAVEFYRQALQLYNSSRNQSGVGTMLNNLGVVALEHGRLDEAEDCFTQALQILQEAGDHSMVGTVWNNLGRVAFRRGELDEAKDRYLKALAIALKVGDRSMEGTVRDNLGVVALEHGRLDEAEDWFTQALAAQHEAGDRSMEATVLRHMGRVDVKRGQRAAAENHFQQALKIALEVENPALERAITDELANLETERGP